MIKVHNKKKVEQNQLTSFCAFFAFEHFVLVFPFSIFKNQFYFWNISICVFLVILLPYFPLLHLSWISYLINHLNVFHLYIEIFKFISQNF